MMMKLKREKEMEKKNFSLSCYKSGGNISEEGGRRLEKNVKTGYSFNKKHRAMTE